MRRTFLLWLMVFMIIGFFATFAISFYVQTVQAEENGHSLIQLRIEDVKQQLDINIQNLEDIRTESDLNALAKVRALAKMVELNPDIIFFDEILEDIKVMLEVDEMHISDAEGILIGGTEAAFLGYDMASDPQSAAFMPALTDKDFELVQDPMPKGINKEIFQYAGVARIDLPGIIQVGYRPEKLALSMEVADIKNLAAGFRVGKSGILMIADEDGTIVSIGDTQYLDKSLEEYGFAQGDFDDPEARSLLATVNGQKSLFAYEDYEGYRIIGLLPADEMYLNRNSTIQLLTVFNLAMFTVIFILIAFLVQKKVINGIYQVNDSLQVITEGNLDESVDVRTNAEFESLSDGINTMVAALKGTIKEVETKIDAELYYAKTIQLAALPTRILETGEHHRFNVKGSMFTAKEVGGDFYDFFVVDKNLLGVAIADVSGKGIPAAMFMMEAKSLIKHYGLTKISVSEVLRKANQSLCENNRANMFVTAFLGIIDLETGVFSFCNAGHNPPLISRQGGDYSWLKSKAYLVLGGMEDIAYCEQDIFFEPGDRLFLYTDGITEATNSAQELYSEERLLKTINRLPRDMPIGDLMLAVKEDVDSYAAGAEQADDITMLVLEYLGGKTWKSQES
ncbi:MAG: SpoIIE family protein phosphatase [Clostridiaceae bacterium]|nr:SpoIIE family protein phosphatase [Clostridiaceae bacterium]